MFDTHSSRRPRRSDFHSQARSLLYSGYRTGNQEHFISRSVIARLLAGFLMVAVLTVSTLVVPGTSRFLVVSAEEVSQDIRFAYLNGNLSTDFATAVSSFTNRMLPLITGERKNRVNRIEILPGDALNIRQGEPVDFSAIAYSIENIPIGGLKFDWSVADANSDLPAYPLADGTFSAITPGHFVITASTEGFQTQVNITVEKSQTLEVLQKIKDESAKGNLDEVTKLKRSVNYTSGTVDSKKSYQEKVTTVDDPQPGVVAMNKTRGPNAGNEGVEYETSSVNSRARVMRRPADQDGWDNSNWWMADDPGNQTGNPPGTSPDAGAGNGNFQFSAPVVALPGRGVDIALSLNYNSRVWSKAGSVMSFDAERGSPAPGWNLGFGKMMFMGTSGGCLLIDADGTNHGYAGTISNWNNGGNSSTSQFVGNTTDGTFINYNCTAQTTNGITTTTGSASLPNGTVVSYNSSSANGKQTFPTKITDAQGNYITASYRNNQGPSLLTVTDTLGRVITFNYDSLGRLISVDVPKMNNSGTRTAVRLHYKTLTLNPGFAPSITADTNNASPYVVDAIYYPGTGTGYWFGADPVAGDYNTYYSSYGMIAKVVEQRGMGWSGAAGDQGTVSAGSMSKQAVYDYPLVPDYTITDAPTYPNLTESWAGMDTAPAVTNYSLNMSASPRTISVTQPNGLKSKQYMYNAAGQWNDGLIYQDETLDASNNQLSKSVVTWAQGDYVSARPTQTEVTDEKGQVLKTTYTYGTNYNQVISQKQYDYDGTTLLKETRNTYENSSAYTGNRHIFNLVTSTEIYDGNNNRQAKTDYSYDGATPADAPNVTMFSAKNDPYNTQMYNTGVCLNWYQPPQGGPVCTQWQIAPVYDSSTLKRGNLTQITSYSDAAPVTPTGALSQTKAYDKTGNVRSESASCCELSTYDYTVATQYAYPTTHSRGASNPNSTLRNTSTAVYDFYTGLIKEATDANGRPTTTTYNPDTLRPTQTTLPTGAYSVTTYDEAAMKITEEVKESNGDPAGKTVTYLNGIGRVKKQESIGPNNVIDIAEVIYNQLGNEWKRSRPYRAGDTVYWSETFYDIQGRVTKVAEPDGSETKAFYNEALYPDSALVNGNPLPGSSIRVQDAWGRDRWGRYDALSRLAEVVEPNPDRSSNPTGRLFDDQGSRINGSLVTKYSYDTLGRLIQSEQGGQLRKFKFDSLGRITRQKLAEQVATLNNLGQYVGENGDGATWSSAASYDNRSNLIQRTDARGVKTNYSYQLSGGGDDPLNRLQSVSYDLSGPHDTSKPIAAAAGVSYEYMTTGDQDRLKKVTVTGVSTEEFAYDTEARVTDYTKTILNRSSYPMVTSNTYDTLSRVTSTRYPAQYGIAGSPRKLLQNEFDTASRLKTLKVDGAQQAGDIVYNAADQTTSVKIGTATANQITEEYTFDQQTGMLTRQKAIRNGTTTLLDLSYDYSRNNSVGNLNGKTGHLTKITDNLNNNRNREFEFDAIGRLLKAKGGTNSLWTQSYSYDRYGNRTSVVATGVSNDAGSTPMVPDGIPNLAYNTASNRITTSNGTGQFEYDVAGNQTRALAQDGVNWLRFEYDAANRLVEIKQDNGTAVQSQQFGSGNDRISLTDHVSNQKTYYADGAVEYTEFSGNGVLVWTKSLVYFGDSVLSTITPDGQGGEYAEYNHPDHLGTRLITNQQAGTSYGQTNLPFGNALDAESTGSTGRRFTSYERSARTGLDYALNRTYDPKQGRFSQVDPIAMGSVSLSNPQTLNLYAYCTNDPVNYVDPSGLGFFSFLKKLFKWIIVAIAVIVAVITIIAAPPTIAGLLGAISAGAGAISTVAGALGYNKVARIFGLIAVVTGFGSLIAGKLGVGNKLFGFSVAKEEASKWFSPWTGITLGVGAIVNSFQQVELSGEKRKQWDTAQFVLLSVLGNPNSRCYKFLKSKGFDPDAIAKDLKTQKPYDGFLSTNAEDFGAAGASPKEFFEAYRNSKIPLDAATSPSGNIYYGNARGGIRSGLVLHENLHRQLPSVSEDALGRKLGTWKSQKNRDGTSKDSSAINKTLEANGCK